MLAYKASSDFMDEYVWIGESTTLQHLKKFVTVVVDVFFEEYLGQPNYENIASFLVRGQHWGFSCMLSSIDCMHWKWKNCLATWKSHYCGHIHKPTIILEVVASYDLWI